MSERERERDVSVGLDTQSDPLSIQKTKPAWFRIEPLAAALSVQISECQDVGKYSSTCSHLAFQFPPEYLGCQFEQTMAAGKADNC